MRFLIALVLPLALGLTGCGPTIGDSCTTASDCLNSLCLNQDFAPGGYCSKACDADKNDCPAGTVCVREALGHDASACFRLCNGSADCRSGYACRTTKDSPLVCVGPTGI